VVYANGNVSVCEAHEPLGNLRQHSFWEIWNSARATALKESITAKACHCTGEIALWSSIVYQPKPLVHALAQSGAFRKLRPLAPGEKIMLTPVADNPARVAEAQ
jgi:hypothetical protein